MTKSITYRGTTITEGSTYYMEGFETPLLVRAFVLTTSHKAFVSYGDDDFILSVDTLMNRIRTGHLLEGGRPAYLVGMMFEVPTTRNIATIKAISPRKAIAIGSNLPQFIYFVQHIDANGNLQYVSLGERQLDSYNRLGSVTVKPFPSELEHDDDAIDSGEYELTP